MNLAELEKNWNQLGADDPLWAVLSDPQKKNGGWDPGVFFKTGEVEIAELLKQLEIKKMAMSKRHALDFGCGAGRLTQALAQYFDSVSGVDIAASMITVAKDFDVQNKCSFYLNTKNNLSLFKKESFDFIYSNITLQHIHPRYSRGYLRNFARVLKKDGVLVFQLPSHLKVEGVRHKISKMLPDGILEKTYYRLKYKDTPRYEMHGIQRNEVEQLLGESGMELVCVEDDYSCGNEWQSYRYFAQKC